MARSIRSAALETRTSRLKLAQRWKPYTARIAPGLRLGYRRKATSGSWSTICADGKGGNWLKAFADADDFEDANGKTILTYWQAVDRARGLARGEDDRAGDSGRPITVAEALVTYEADLKARGGGVSSVARVRLHLPVPLIHQSVALLTARELKRWRDGLLKPLTPGSINRISNTLRAALNLAADTDERISRRAWEIGLKAVPGGTVARNVILPPDAIRRVVSEAYGISKQFGLLVEVAATTGARVGQLRQLEVCDVQSSRADPRLMVPASRKGRGTRMITHQPVAIPQALALRLRQAGKGRAGHDPLLVKAGGQPWRRSDHTRLFARAAGRAGVDPSEVTLYALRHSSIVRQLLAGVPVRVVAAAHDTSVVMIERNYSKRISDHSDALVRPTLLDLSEPARDNIVPLAR
jgi:integrase